jgi:hypothetical protein
MRYYVAKPAIDALKAHIEANYQDFIEDLSEASDTYLEPIAYIGIGNDFEKAGRAKPFLLIDPTSDSIDNDVIGTVSTSLSYDVLIAVTGDSEGSAITKADLYKDAFISMILSDDFLSGLVDDAQVTSVEHYPGGTVTTKYILLALTITIEQGRD